MKSAVHYAGFWRRLLAFIIDSLLFFAITTPILYLIYGHGYLGWVVSNHDFFSSYGFFETLVNEIAYLLVVLFMWVNYGATPGKILMECRIVNARDFVPITHKQAVIRMVGYLVAALPIYLGFAWIAFDRRKQGLHDKLAGTVVIHQIDGYETLSLQQLQDNLI